VAKNRKADVALDSMAAVATILGVVLSIYSMVRPSQINDFTGRILGQVELGGPIRAEFVSGQKWLFIATWVIISLSIGLGGAGLWNRIESLKARDIAAGRETRMWHNFLLPLLAIPCVSLGVTLPKAIFLPTNTTELARQFAPGAWALRSTLGGIVLGLCILATTALVAFGVYRTVLLVRSLRGKQYQRIMANS